MTNNPALLHTFIPYTGSDQVMVWNGKFLPITHIGSSILTTDNAEFVLNHVLLVPSLCKNLICVAKFTKDNNVSFEMFDWGYNIKDLATNEVVAEGPFYHNLYPIQMVPKVSFSSIIADPSLWHQRLGNPSGVVLSKLNNTSAIQLSSTPTTSLCHDCQLGKHVKLPFQSSNRVSSKPLALVHYDVWGPAPVTSLEGYKYYIVFIDDFSRFHWIYLITTKTDALKCFQHLKAVNENFLSA